MVHFELDNIIVLRYAVDSCRRFLKKKRIEIAADKKLLNLFAKLSHAFSREYRDIFKKAHAEIFPSNAIEKQDYIDIKGWIEEKVKAEQ